MRPFAISIDPAENLTRQSFKDECDVNNIVATYADTGMINHLPRGEPQYGEAPSQTFHESACIMAEIGSLTEEGALDGPVTDSEEESPEKALHADPEASEEVSESEPEGEPESPEKGA